MEFLARNALGSITLTGLLTQIKHYRHNPHYDPPPPTSPVTFTRQSAPYDLVNPTVFFPDPPNSRYKTFIPPRNPDPLPPSSNHHLKARLGDRLGYIGSDEREDDIGWVFELLDVEVEGLPAGVMIPPLVAKVARPHRGASLAREAWFYDELGCLQGSTIARCFGWFEADIEDHPAYRDEGMCLFGEYHEPGQIDDVLALEKGCGKVHEEIAKRVVKDELVQVLVFERLGYTPRTMRRVGKGIRSDILTLFKDIGDLGVEVTNLSMGRILTAPIAPGAMHTLPSPKPTRIHNYRVIGFSRAEKTNASLCELEKEYRPSVHNICNRLEDPYPDLDNINALPPEESDGGYDSDASAWKDPEEKRAYDRAIRKAVLGYCSADTVYSDDEKRADEAQEEREDDRMDEDPVEPLSNTQATQATDSDGSTQTDPRVRSWLARVDSITREAWPKEKIDASWSPTPTRRAQSLCDSPAEPERGGSQVEPAPVDKPWRCEEGMAWLGRPSTPLV